MLTVNTAFNFVEFYLKLLFFYHLKMQFVTDHPPKNVVTLILERNEAGKQEVELWLTGDCFPAIWLDGLSGQTSVDLIWLDGHKIFILNSGSSD